MEGPNCDPDSAAASFGQQPVDQMPWGHNILIFTKCSSVTEARFYIAQTLQQGWSRDVLALQLSSPSCTPVRARR